MYVPALPSELSFDSGLKLCSIATEFFCVFDKVECSLSTLTFYPVLLSFSQLLTSQLYIIHCNDRWADHLVF